MLLHYFFFVNCLYMFICSLIIIIIIIILLASQLNNSSPTCRKSNNREQHKNSCSDSTKLNPAVFPTVPGQPYEFRSALLWWWWFYHNYIYIRPSMCICAGFWMSPCCTGALTASGWLLRRTWVVISGNITIIQERRSRPLLV